MSTPRARATAGPSVALAREALDAVLAPAEWIVGPLGGSGDRTFLARADRAVVVRFDANPAVLRRVAALGVGPDVLASGEARGQVFAIQEHVAAAAIHVPALARRHEELARLVATYAADAELTRLARTLEPGDALADAAARVAGSDDPGQWRSILEALVERAADLETGRPVASHGDPNSANILATPSRLLLVDWDDLRAADPMRDLGQLAWWYLPRRRCPAFIEAAGVRWTPAVEARLFWWVASESLDVALRLAAADPDAAIAFRRDAQEALAGRVNPRRAR